MEEYGPALDLYQVDRANRDDILLPLHQIRAFVAHDRRRFPDPQ